MYYSVLPQPGAGSGEYWNRDNTGLYFGLKADISAIRNFKDFRGGYIREKDGYIYYLDLNSTKQDLYPGQGKLCRMKPDTQGIQIIENDIVYGNFIINDDKIYYQKKDDKGFYIINIDGLNSARLDNKNIEVSESMGLNLGFYGDFVIQKYSSKFDSDICMTKDFRNDVELPDNLEVLNWNENKIFFFNNSLQKFYVYTK